MFEPLRDALRDLTTRLTPDERRTMTQSMRDALVHAKLGLNDLRASLATTDARLAAERAELDTVRRRQGLAAAVGDQETVAVAERFSVQHQERVAMLEAKQMVQQQELSLAERDVEAMSAELRLILSGVAPGAPSREAGSAEPLPTEHVYAGGDADRSDDALEVPPVSPARRTRAEREADAEQRLAALKRRMGK